MADEGTVPSPELDALTELLEHDSRPTFIINRAPSGPTFQHSTTVAYRNPALDRFYGNATDRIEKALLDLINGLAADIPTAKKWTSKNIHGKRWSLTLVKERWKVVQYAGVTKRLASDLLDRLGTESVTSSAGSETSDDLSGTTNSAAHDEVSEALAAASDGHFKHSETARRLDWTRWPVPDLTPYHQFVRDFDFSKTAVGPMQTWPVQLRQVVIGMMTNPDPRIMMWGTELTYFYNEACLPFFQAKHPRVFGSPASEAWSEVWPVLDPIIRGVMEDGKVTKMEKLPLTVERNGYPEETFFTFTMLPLVGPDGYVIGAIDEVQDVTQVTVGERRRSHVLRLGELVSSANTLKELTAKFVEGVEPMPEDVCFALLYILDDDVDDRASFQSGTSGSSSSRSSARKCVLESKLGVADETAAALKQFVVSDEYSDPATLSMAFWEARRTGRSVMLTLDGGNLPADLAKIVPGRGYGDCIRAALVLPLESMGGNDVIGFLVVGLNPRSQFDEEYRLYTHFLGDIIVKAAALISLPEEQRRSQKIAEDIHTALAQQLRITTLEAERSEDKFIRMAKMAPVGMFMLKPDGTPLYINDVYLQQLELTQEEYKNKAQFGYAWADKIHPDDVTLVNDFWTGWARGRPPSSFEFRLKRIWRLTDKVSGKEMSGPTWMSASAYPDIDEDGRVRSIQGWMTDISYQKYHDRLMAERLEEALENKRQSENFIDMTSHEMRNPLSAILQCADSIVTTLQEAGTPQPDDCETSSRERLETIKDAAQTIVLCAQHQKCIVDDILTLSKLDSNLLLISPDRVQPPELVQRALKMYEAELERDSIECKVCIDKSYEELQVDVVAVDPSRTLQVIINLLTNAIKFTRYCETRQIRLCLGASRQRPTGESHGVSFIPSRPSRSMPQLTPELGYGEDLYIEFAVYDTGKGITEEELKMLFQRFQQASPKTYKTYGGSGLGLFISRELTELQGGQIGVQSEAGKSTQFRFFVKSRRCLPLPEATQDIETRTAIGQTLTASMPINQEKSLTPTAPVDRKDTPNEEAATEEKNLVSTVLNAAAASLRPPPPARSQASEDLRQRPPSPVPPTSIPTPTIPSPAATSPGHRTFQVTRSDLHVLVVEDNLVNARVIATQLRKAGCTVTVANHGGECLDFLEQTVFSSGSIPLSIILLDWEMPVMDGLTCIRHIRERQQAGTIRAHIPVIGVTANARSEQIAVAIGAGMDQVVTKPFRIPDLVPQMEALVEKFKGA